mmetsp:Transcript_12585/g.14394  ORF Transcript_12585/g.14394 Transcript_12585/m.14394 type:complete len:424 (+) Transcript_12585:284-1555(+)
MFSSTANITVIQWILLFSLAVVSAAAVSLRAPSTTGSDHHADLGYDHQNPKASSSATVDKLAERILKSQWDKHRRWSKVASERKKMLEIGRISKLVLISSGAVAQVASTQLPVEYKAFANLFSGACLGAGTYIKTNFLTVEKIKKNAACFKTSQAIKAEVYQFRARVGHYGKEPEKAVDLLRQRCSSISSKTKDHKFLNTLPDSHPAPARLDTMDEYIEKRMDHIIQDFYRKQARSMNKKASIISNCENALLSMAFLASSIPINMIPDAFQNAFASFSGWGVAFTAVSTAFANHLAKEKFSDRADDYSRAAEQLEAIKDNWPLKATKAGAPGWENTVIECENIIHATFVKEANTRTGSKDLPQELKPLKKDVHKMVWNPAVVCGTDNSGFYRASARVEWLVDNSDLSKQEAQKKIMSEFPENF